MVNKDIFNKNFNLVKKKKRKEKYEICRKKNRNDLLKEKRYDISNTFDNTSVVNISKNIGFDFFVTFQPWW